MSKDSLYRIFDRLSEYSLYGLIFFIPISIAGVEILSCCLFSSFCLKRL